MRAVDQARAAYVAYCQEIGSDAVSEESAILSIGREFLPRCAQAVLDDRDADSVEYYEFLMEQTREAQTEHERALRTMAGALEARGLSDDADALAAIANRVFGRAERTGPEPIECIACGKETVPVEGEPRVCPCGALLTTDGGAP
jgi:hypothetical protein